MLSTLNENFRQYSRGTAEFTHLKIICMFVNFFCYQRFKKDISKSAATATGFTTEDEHLTF